MLKAQIAAKEHQDHFSELGADLRGDNSLPPTPLEQFVEWYDRQLAVQEIALQQVSRHPCRKENLLGAARTREAGRWRFQGAMEFLGLRYDDLTEVEEDQAQYSLGGRLQAPMQEGWRKWHSILSGQEEGVKRIGPQHSKSIGKDRVERLRSLGGVAGRDGMARVRELCCWRSATPLLMLRRYL